MDTNTLQAHPPNSDFDNGTNEDEIPVPRSLLLDAVNTFIACLAVLGNILVITVMLIRRRVFNSFTNRLILHQSVIDATAGMVFFFHKVVRPPQITVSIEGNIYDEMVCRFIHSDFLLWAVNVVSTYNLVIISLERFMATCYPVKHRNAWSIGRMKFAAVTAWGIGFGYGSHMLLIYESDHGRCQATEMELGLKVLVGVTVVSVEYLVPILIMIFAYTKILITLGKKRVYPANAQHNSLTKAKKNVLITILLAGAMFVVCWTPSEYDYMKELFFSETWDETIYIALTGLLACNMFVNPIIYCLNYRQFRSQLKDLLRRNCCKNQMHDDQTVISVSVLQRPAFVPVSAS